MILGRILNDSWLETKSEQTQIFNIVKIVGGYIVSLELIK